MTYGGHDYAFCDGIRIWDIARQECELLGMRLARVDDAAEDNWIATTGNDLFTNTGRDCMWLGGDDLATEGDWRWQDGEAFWSGGAFGVPVGGLYTNWDVGDPNNLNGVENCLCGYIARNPAWIDADCGNYRTRFVCELY